MAAASPRSDHGADHGADHAVGEGPESAKAVLRAEVRARRGARPQAERTRLACGLRDVVVAGAGLRGDRPGAPRVVAAYADRGGEPGTGPLVTTLLDLGAEVLLPVTHDGRDGHGVRLGWVRAPEAAGLERGVEALATAELVLLPALAVDTTGRRLGQGGGYYDRTLAELQRVRGSLPPLVALLHDDEVLDACVQPVPAEPHDVRVTHVATPTRWLRLDGA